VQYLRRSDKSSRWVYRRRVPVDVCEPFGRVWVEQSLGTADMQEAKRRAAILTVELEAAWDALRSTSRALTKGNTEHVKDSEQPE
jgi:hypothetical protein